ncbi:hypothetical protein ENT52713_17520 [Enterobacter sp. 200527-13]|nr:hypothetical protein ENT52713_17520 [Enterobacter sp. 200527-13]
MLKIHAYSAQSEIDFRSKPLIIGVLNESGGVNVCAQKLFLLSFRVSSLHCARALPVGGYLFI